MPGPEDDGKMPVDQMLEDEEINEEEEELEGEEELILGKFKTSEDAINSIPELEKTLGKQGNQIGTLQKEKEFLMEQIQNNKGQDDGEEEEQLDLVAKIDEITQQMDAGDISTGEGSKQIAELTAQHATENATKKILSQQQQAKVDQSRESFIEQNPDFTEVLDSGALDKIKNTLPGLHDDFSAFFEHKATTVAANTAAQVEAAKKEGIEIGKAEMAKIAGGAKNTSKVLKSANSDTGKKIGVDQKPLSKTELEESGMEALLASRGSG